MVSRQTVGLKLMAKKSRGLWPSDLTITSYISTPIKKIMTFYFYMINQKNNIYKLYIQYILYGNIVSINLKNKNMIFFVNTSQKLLYCKLQRYISEELQRIPLCIPSILDKHCLNNDCLFNHLRTSI